MADQERVYSLDDAITDGIDSLDQLEPTTKEYTTAVENLEKLTEIKKGLTKPRKGPSPDGILAATVAILQIGAILIYESYGHIISSKATNFIWKGRDRS